MKRPNRPRIIRLSNLPLHYEDLSFKPFKNRKPKLPAVTKDLSQVTRWLTRQLSVFWSWYENPTYGIIKKSAKAGGLWKRRKPSRGLFAWYKYLDHQLTVKDAILIILALLLLWALFVKDHKVIAEPAKPAEMPKLATYKPVKAPKLVKQSTRAKIVPPAPKAPVRASGTVSGCGDNSYANFIYMHESGCRLDARNAGGCLGIGQACPGSKLLAVCPTMSYVCQNAYFSSYAIGRYGSWAGAYNYWFKNHWW